MSRLKNRPTRSLATVIILAAAVVCAGGLTACKSGGGSGSGAGIVDNNPATGSATLSWSAPAANEDGSPLDDLDGYNVYMGPASGNYTDVFSVGSSTEVEITDLDAGTYYFVVTAVDLAGNESPPSEEVSKEVMVQ